MGIFERLRKLWRGAPTKVGEPVIRQRVISQVNTATGKQYRTVPAESGSIGERQALPAERISQRQRVRQVR